MAIINVDDAYILNETGAQVDKTTGIPFKNESLTEAEAEQARANIRAGGSNRNLLDNAYFVGGGSQLGDGVFPINQRGQTSYSTATNTTIDRWKTEYSALSVDTDGITWTATGDNRQFAQVIDDAQLIEGETYTASILADVTSGGARIFLGGTSSPWPTVSGSMVNIQSGLTTVTFTFSRASGYTGKYKFALASTSNGTTVKLYACKLERGFVSTLANDPPPDFGEELRKCQRYLWVKTFPANTIIGSGLTFNTNTIYDIVTPVAMRTGGTLTMTTSTSLYVVYNATYALAGVVNGITSHGNHLRVSMNNNGGSDYGTLNHADLLVSYETVVTVANEL